MHYPFSAIVAMAQNRVIGQQGRLPWHLPEDFKWFRDTTLGQCVVMGRKTYESIGRPLPGRETVVLTRQSTSISGVRVISSLDELIQPDPAQRKIIIAGGAEVYRLAMPRCFEVWLTLVRGDFSGDAWMPPFEDLFAPPRLLREYAQFSIYHYVR